MELSIDEILKEFDVIIREIIMSNSFFLSKSRTNNSPRDFYMHVYWINKHYIMNIFS